MPWSQLLSGMRSLSVFDQIASPDRVSTAVTLSVTIDGTNRVSPSTTGS